MASYQLYRKTRNQRRKRSRRSRRTAGRRRRTSYKARGGGFSFSVPDSALVEYRSLDDDGTNPPILMLNSKRNKAMADMERA
jgi:hypothetical protein